MKFSKTKKMKMRKQRQERVARYCYLGNSVEAEESRQRYTIISKMVKDDNYYLLLANEASNEVCIGKAVYSGYVKVTDYSEANAEIVSNYVSEYTAKINAAETIETANAQLAEAKGKIEIAKKLDDKTSTFINTLNTAENTVVSGKAASTDEFATNTITADLKAGEMYLNFIASSDLVKKLTENNAYARENKVVVTVDGLSAVELDLPVLRQSTTLKISGMSFEQLYGTVTIKLVFNYPDNTGLNFETAEVVFDGSAAVAATNSSVADAFAAYMKK